MPGSPDKRSPSIRDIAAAAGVSPMTVSRALRGDGSVTPALREKIKRVAGTLGYVRNPLAGALMSEMRRSRAKAFQGLLAVLDVDGPAERTAGPRAYHAELVRGATERALSLGFSADLITAGKGNLTVERLDSILRARGIRGVFILPVREAPELTRLDWANYAGIYSDFLIEQPRLHSICSDHYRAILTALERLRALGYRRPGLVLNAFHNARLLHRQEAAYRAFIAGHLDMTFVPPFASWRPNEADFREWFDAVGCDVVLSNNAAVPAWMRAAGARVPETHGFCALNVVHFVEPCAGLDLQPRLIGERGMEMLIGMVLRNERGAPEQAIASALSARWVEGPTVRDQGRAVEAAPDPAVWRWTPPADRKADEYPITEYKPWLATHGKEAKALRGKA